MKGKGSIEGEKLSAGGLGDIAASTVEGTLNCRIAPKKKGVEYVNKKKQCD